MSKEVKRVIVPIVDLEVLIDSGEVFCDLPVFPLPGQKLVKPKRKTPVESKAETPVESGKRDSLNGAEQLD